MALPTVDRREQLIIRQTCAKAACEVVANLAISGYYEPADLSSIAIGIAEDFEGWITR